MWLCVYIYIYTYMYRYVYVNIYIYIHIYIHDGEPQQAAPPGRLSVYCCSTPTCSLLFSFSVRFLGVLLDSVRMLLAVARWLYVLDVS